MKHGSILASCAAALLAACHGDAGTTPVAQAAPRPKAPIMVRHGPTPAESTRGMVEATTIGKSAVPVDVKFDLAQRPVVGRPLELVIVVMPLIEANPAVLQVTGSDGLQVAPDSLKPIEMPSVVPTEVYRHSIQLRPTVEGVQLVALSVSLKHDEITEARSFSVPLIVAASDPAAAGPAGGAAPGAAPPSAAAAGPASASASAAASPLHAGER